MTVTSCGEDDEVKPHTELGADGQGNSENEEANGSEDNSGNDEVSLENPDGGIAVDLGLPSGTLWADRNIGAKSPENHGDYFAWGETEPKSRYSWSTYKWCNGSYDSQTKYCANNYYGPLDGKIELELADDAARAYWGGTWRMPSKTQFEELKEECTWTWTTMNGVSGYKVVSKKNSNSIFFPAAGYHGASSLGRFRSVWAKATKRSTCVPIRMVSLCQPANAITV